MACLKDSLVGHNLLYYRMVSELQQDHLGSTHLLVGPSGVGKFAFVLALSQRILCERPQEERACGSCGSCLRVAKRQMESLFVVESEGVQIKIDEARKLKEFLNLRAVGRQRVVIIRDAEKLNPQAANALLKTLEEPPEGTYLFLVTKSLASLLPTIRSRSMVWRFSPLTMLELKSLSQAPEWMMRASQGRMDLLQELESSEGNWVKGNLSWSLKKMFSHHSHEVLDSLRELAKDKSKTSLWLRFFQQFIRDAAIINENPQKVIHEDQRQILETLSKIPRFELSEIYHDVHQLSSDLDRPYDRSLALESFIYNLRDRIEGVAH